MNSNVSIPKRTTVTLDIVNGDLEIEKHATVRGTGSRQKSAFRAQYTPRVTTPSNAHCQPKNSALKTPSRSMAT